MVGAAMHSRFAAEGKPGVTTRSGRELLDVVERRPAHDAVLPQHDRPAHRDDRQPDADRRFRSCPTSSCRDGDCRIPIAPQAVALPAVDRLLDHRELRGARLRLARPRELPLQHLPDGEELDRARAAATPGRSRRRAIAAVKAEIAQGDAAGPKRRTRAVGGGGARGGADEVLRSCCTSPTMRDPRGYIIPSDQPDFLTATKFVNTLIKAGVAVQRATAPFTVGRQAVSRPARYVVKTAQAFRAARARHVRAAGPPERHSVSGRPADVRRTTTPATRSRYQMGVQFDRDPRRRSTVRSRR